jgi:hypothetical protein
MFLNSHTMKWCVSISAAALLASGPALAQKDGDGDASADVLPPTYGIVTLETGYLDDPFGVALQAGGNVDAATIDPNCWGNVAEAPDVALDYTAGNTFPLNIYVGSDADPTLLVMDPSGNISCNDDFNGLQPAVIYDSPESGRYHIWVGTYSGGFPEATLYISEVFTAPSEADPIFGPIAQAEGGDEIDDQPAEESATPESDDTAEAPAGGPSSALALFEMAAQMSGGMMTYASATALGDNGFEAVGLTINPPEGGDPITIETVRVDEMDWQSALSDGMPSFIDLTVEGLHVPNMQSLPDMDQEAIDLFGNELTANFELDYTAEAGGLVVDQLVVDLVDQMLLNMTMDVGNFDIGALNTTGPMALMGATINGASMSYTDSGFMSRALEMGAAESGMQVDQAIQMGTMQLQAMGGMVTSEGGQAAMNALLAFMNDLPNPSGTLSVDVAPPSPVNPMALMSIASPDAAVQTLGLTVTYE